MPIDIGQLAQAIAALGCPPEKSAEMAAQLDRRARQLAAAKSRSYEDALRHLLGLMQQGWAAQQRASRPEQPGGSPRPIPPQRRPEP